MSVGTQDKIDLKELVDRGLKLSREVAALERKKTELDQIKAILRDEAKGKDIDFKGSNGSIARVEQKADTICRVIPDSDMPRAVKLAGDSAPYLFTFHPSKGNEKSFELNAFKNLAQKTAKALIDLLTVPATPWVRFS